MGFQVYEQPALHRWAGYGVPAACDQQGCEVEITRGVEESCERVYEQRYLKDGEEVDAGEDFDEEIEVEVDGCGLFFCGEHRHPTDHLAHDQAAAKPDSAEWQQHMLEHPSWGRWRAENPERVAAMRAAS